MRVAVTSQNFRTITGHAGKACRFLVYESDDNGDVTGVERLDLPKELSFHEFQGEGEHPVDGCDVVVTQSCGFGFARRLAGRGIQVLITSETDPFKAACAVMQGNPLPAPDMRSSHNHEHHDGNGCCHG